MVGAPQCARGDEVVLFLKGSAPAVPMPFGLTQGVYRVNRDAAGRAMVTPPANWAPNAWCAATPPGGHSSSARSPAWCGRSRARGHERPRACVDCASPPSSQGFREPRTPTSISASISAGDTRPLKWTASRVRWYANDRRVPGVSASQFQSELAQAFTTWEDVPTASIAFQFAGFTSAIPFDDDDLSVFGFQNEPDMDRVLGATTFIVDVITGTIVESDVFFNSIFPWSVAPTGDPARFDLPARWPRTKSVTSSALAIRPSGKPK